MILGLLSPSHAYSVVCVPEFHMWPQTAMASADTVPLVRGSFCEDEDAAVVSLLRDGEVIEEHELVAMQQWVGFVELLEPLEAGSEYELRVTPELGTEQVHAFTATSDALIASAEGPHIEAVWTDGDVNGGQIRFDVEVAGDPNDIGTFVALFDEDDGLVGLSSMHADPTEDTVTAWLTGSRRDRCISSAQRYPDGAWVDGNEDCVEKLSCSTGGTGAGTLALLLGGLALRRRRC